MNLEPGVWPFVQSIREGALDQEDSPERVQLELAAIVRRVRDEFFEMPGLVLTVEQATRLWGLEHETCRAVIDELVKTSFLCWTPGGTVRRATDKI